MKLFSRIQIRNKSSIADLHMPDELCAGLESTGLKFFQVGQALVGDSTYQPNDDLLTKTKNIVERYSNEFKVKRFVWPEYEDADYQNAPLWVLYFPDVWLREIDSAMTCSSCNRKMSRIDPRQKVEEVKGATNRPFLNVNGQFGIIRRDVADSFVNSLSGLHVEMFDKAGQYMYLLPTSQLSSLIIRDDEVFGFKGFCDECNSPKFDMYFGPLRYPAQSWNGNDIVFEPFHRTPVFSHKAANLILDLDKNNARGGVIVLE